MRISDWSSDVCSSDLVYDAVERALNLDPGALGGPGDGYVPAVAQDRVKNVRPASEAICPVPDDAPPIARKAKSKKMGKPTTIWTYRNEHGRPMGHVARYDIPATETNPADKVIRSEEHTSELQSLMRISYAVLCLTKN